MPKPNRTADSETEPSTVSDEPAAEAGSAPEPNTMWAGLQNYPCGVGDCPYASLSEGLTLFHRASAHGA